MATNALITIEEQDEILKKVQAAIQAYEDGKLFAKIDLARAEIDLARKEIDKLNQQTKNKNTEIELRVAKIEKVTNKIFDKEVEKTKDFNTSGLFNKENELTELPGDKFTFKLESNTLVLKGDFQYFKRRSDVHILFFPEGDFDNIPARFVDENICVDLKEYADLRRFLLDKSEVNVKIARVAKGTGVPSKNKGDSFGPIMFSQESI